MGNFVRASTVKYLKPLLFCLVAQTMAPANALAGFFENSDRAILDAGGSISRVAPNWKIVCLGRDQDVFGGVTTQRHCRIEKNDFRAIAVITSEGLSIPYRPSRPACLGYSGNMRVDEKSIGKLPLKAKIAAMSQGVSFARSYQTQWPDCQRLIEFTGLYRFSTALARLREQWRKFK
jgi:hypothetical protein